jgi:hypothetical protein
VVETLLQDAPWNALYPTSSVFSPDEKKLYIGMRQFVGEFDIQTRQFRMLIPSESFQNRLAPEDETRIREPFKK